MQSAVDAAGVFESPGLRLTSEIHHLLRGGKLQQSHKADDVKYEGDYAQCEHGHRSGLQFPIELQAHDLPNRNDDDEKIRNDVRDLKAIVKGYDRDAGSFHHWMPVLLHWHTEEECCQNDAGAPDSNNRDEYVDLPVEIPRMMRK